MIPSFVRPRLLRHWRMGRHIIFKCPRTGMNVQHWLDEAGPVRSEDAYKSVDCPACTLAHFIHRETGKLLGEK